MAFIGAVAGACLLLPQTSSYVRMLKVPSRVAVCRTSRSTAVVESQLLQHHIQSHWQVLPFRLVLGTAYPIYSSFALLESRAPAKEREQEAAQWLTYWAVYGIISATEQMFETRPPLYYHVKLAFLFWLQSSRYQGARRLYVIFLRPFLAEHRSQIEAGINFCYGLVARPEVLYVGNHIHNWIAKIPYLKWFVQTFEDPAKKGRFFSS